MFLLLRKCDEDETVELVNVSAIQTARAVTDTLRGEPFSGTIVVWNTDGRYKRYTEFDTQRETIYNITYDDFIAKIAEAGEMCW